MIPFRLQVKYFIENTDAFELSPFIGIFQRWIQQASVPGMLLDVADYGHVFQGPGVVLIGHEGDYSLDMGNGRPGLLYTRKRQVDSDLPQQIRATFAAALAACNLIENEPLFKVKLKFRTDDAEIRLLDRLRYPNRPETFDLVRDDLKAVIGEVYGDTQINLVPVNDNPRHPFTIRVEANGAPNIATLLQSSKVKAS